MAASDYPFRYTVTAFEGTVKWPEPDVLVKRGDLVVKGDTEDGVDWPSTVHMVRRNRDTPPLTECRVYVKGDVSLFRGSSEGDRFGPGLRPFYEAEAKRHGVSTSGKVYHSAIAAYPGDPRAWVSDSGDIQAVLKERNWSAYGDVTHKAHEVDPDSPEAFQPKSKASLNEPKMAAAPNGEPTPSVPFLPQ